MNTQEFVNEATAISKQAAITTVMTVLGHGDYFHRVVDHVQRIEASMPSATGKEKRAKFFAEFATVLDDVIKGLIEPFAEQVIRQLLEMALAYATAKAASEN